MLTVLGDALNVAIRRERHPIRDQDWADRFVPLNRRADQDRHERVNIQRHLRW